jgi:hypothetical protein
MKLIKLTTQDGWTRQSTQWGEGVTHELPPVENPQLCTKDVLHAYKDINLALLMNPIHANINHPKAWEADGDVVVDDGLKVGVFRLTTIKEIPLPEWYANETHRKRVAVRFAILCAEAVLPLFESIYPNDDRPRKAIEAAKEYPCKNTAAYAAADAARAAAYAAADAAYAAADAAAYAAADAAKANKNIDFVALANQAVKEVVG